MQSNQITLFSNATIHKHVQYVQTIKGFIFLSVGYTHYILASRQKHRVDVAACHHQVMND
jgi:hypothetical protein